MLSQIATDFLRIKINDGDRDINGHSVPAAKALSSFKRAKHQSYVNILPRTQLRIK